MLSRLLQVVTLLVVHFGTGNATFDHLCSKVTSGRFRDIDLKSITYHNYDKLIIFESDFKYTISSSSIHPTSMPVPEVAHPWNSSELSAPSYVMKINFTSGEYVKSVYMFNQDDSKKGFVMTNQFMYVLDMNGIEQGRVRELRDKIGKSRFGQPDFTIAHAQERRQSWGYVIHKDIFLHTDNFVIYQLEFKDGWTLDLQGPTASYTDHQYHLERTYSPSQVKLVHSSQYESGKSKFKPSNKLFATLPRGFVLHRQLYLFDTEMACVYVVKLGDHRVDLRDLHKSAELELLKDRINVPYEHFFKCSDRFKVSNAFQAVYPPDRCETTNGDKVPTKPTPGIQSNSSDQNPEESKLGATQWYIFGGATLAVVAFLFAFILIRSMSRSKKKAKDNRYKKMGKTPHRKILNPNKTTQKGTPKAAPYAKPPKRTPNKKTKNVTPIKKKTPRETPNKKAHTKTPKLSPLSDSTFDRTSNVTLSSSSSTGTKTGPKTGPKTPRYNHGGTTLVPSTIDGPSRPSSKSVFTSINTANSASLAAPKLKAIVSPKASPNPKSTSSNSSSGTYGGSLIASSLLPTKGPR